MHIVLILIFELLRLTDTLAEYVYLNIMSWKRMSVPCTLLESGLSTQTILGRPLHMQIALMLQVPSATAFDLIIDAAT